jgi:hypothetical protein
VPDRPVDRERCLVGVDDAQRRAVGGHAVGAGHDRGDLHALGHAPARVHRPRPGVGNDVGAQPEDAPVRRERQRGGDPLVPGLRVGLQRLVAVLRPLERPVDQRCRCHDGHLVRVDEGLHAEGASDVLGEHPHRVLRQPELARVEGLQHLRRLSGHSNRQGALLPVEGREDAPHLQRDGGVPAGLHRHLGHPVGRGKGRVHVAAAEGGTEAQIRAQLLVHQRAAVGQRRHRVEDRRQLLVVDDDELGRVLRGGPAGGGDEDDRLADVPHDAGRQGGLQPRDHARPVQQAPPSRAVRREVLGGEGRQHLRRRHCRRSVDVGDPPRGERRPHERDVRLARLGHVVDEASAPDEQGRVLTPPDAAPHVARAGHRAASPAEGPAGVPAGSVVGCPPMVRPAARTASTIVW